VDGGAKFAPGADIWVGDADSYFEEVISPHAFRLSLQKDSSDLALALTLFKNYLRFKLHLWGFLGGRSDHELFNLGEVSRFLESRPESQVYFYDHQGNIRFHFLGQGHWKFDHQGFFSLGTMKKTQVTLKGQCQYLIEQPQTLMPLSSYGLSNQAYGGVQIANEGPVFIYFPEEN
jgi:thiamine pyrophosphokinase